MSYISTTISKQIEKQEGNQIRMCWLTYEIVMSGDDKLWITNQDGEGFEISCEKFYDCVDKFFQDNC